ncbi:MULTISPECIES: TnsD family Tn7-like transposition protein [Acinetobacter]|uniref:TnsD family Tn7-like transposition protein n=1 Tax=Acinetobacter TaxID=469 RepID=UPI00124C6326|nr:MULTISPECIES: TnsD family Tn7-like transposition protein [Acinetobacter]MDX8158771.1 TnsD family Tn7-like transposition protein [Acinetobacter pittii]MDX8263189.1 TnsD family Tn7-like transposition protein [Acinetobacter pittii]MQZ58176.1 transposase [Acinetobacter junii]
MLNFPMPYQHELIYSTVARAGTRLALDSPKQLLDEVFENRKVIATVDLPCHLNAIMHQFSNHQFTVEDIAYQHTLFPIYALFVPEKRRQQCLKWMADISQGSIHLALGVNASRIPPIHKLRYCPQCLAEQLEKYGEYYWFRLWQIQGACCPQHGQLIDSDLDLRSLHRHDFLVPSHQSCPKIEQAIASSDDIFITSKLLELLTLPPSESPSYEQWTMFYYELARQNDCSRGQRQIFHECILERITIRWSKKFLEQYCLADLTSETSWLHNIFRKHRKSFSYLEHIVTIEALINREWSFAEILQQVRSFRKINQNNHIDVHNNHITDLTIKNRENWLNLIRQNGVKPARLLNAALYAWLYRNDKNWLLDTNQVFHQKYIPQGTKVDWHSRDLGFVKQLIKLNNDLLWDLDSPRRSAKWWMKQILHSSTIEKNLSLLPLTELFLRKYNESIGFYQIRRISRALIKLQLEHQNNHRWRVLRLSGLSEERLTEEASSFLNFS